MKKEQIESLLKLPIMDLALKANRVREKFAGKSMDLCTIMNAKSGFCAEDCKFCAQSGRHTTGLATYPLKKKGEIVKAAMRAKKIGARSFGIVTSGDKLSEKDFKVVLDAVKEISANIKMRLCVSLGSMDEEKFFLLKEAGLIRYHHNIETSRRFFPKIVTTHTFEDRLDTIRRAKKCGLEVCSGGIIGMGENMRDRIDMALELKKLDVDSVPINILVPIKGTLMGSRPLLSAQEAIRSIAIFRIILKDKTIKVAAGRESALKDSQVLSFLSGANGMLIGGYLTVKGRSIEDDRKLVEDVEKLWRI
ncbi:MAG: biotin synthase BioB [Candidatus Omnitrophota bacterium]